MKKTWLPVLLTAAIALFVWAVFYPALMSEDSLNQYKQAVSRTFSDWHPPVISLVLSGVLALGGSLGLFMLGQCLAGAFGVTAFARACLEQLHGDRISPRRAAWLSLLVLLILLSPLSPLAFYLMTLWKDVWTIILLLWIGALALRLSRAGRRPPPLLLAGLLLLSAVYGMVRHNAIVTLPLVGLLLAVEARRREVRLAPAVLLALAPLGFCLVLDVLIHRGFHVKERHPGDTVLVLDLVGICAKDETACQQLTYLQWFLRKEGLRSRYRPGDMGAIYWEEPRIVDNAIFAEERRQILLGEYRLAAKSFPLLLAEVKVEAFLPLLQIEKTAYFFQDSLPGNDFGLVSNQRFRTAREALVGWGRDVGRDPVLRWPFGVHLVWLLANAIWIAALLAGARKRGDRRLSALAIFLLVPLGYSLSYLLASPVPDFRFLYPSTLLVQCLTLSWAAGALAARSSRSRTT